MLSNEKRSFIILVRIQPVTFQRAFVNISLVSVSYRCAIMHTIAADCSAKAPSFFFLTQPTRLPCCGNVGHRHFDLPSRFWTIHGGRGQSSPLLCPSLVCHCCFGCNAELMSPFPQCSCRWRESIISRSAIDHFSALTSCGFL